MSRKSRKSGRLQKEFRQRKRIAPKADPTTGHIRGRTAVGIANSIGTQPEPSISQPQNSSNTSAYHIPTDELSKLSVRDEIWHLAIAERNDASTKGSRMFMMGVGNLSRREIRAVTIFDDCSTTDSVLWDDLLSSFFKPLNGVRCRPTSIAMSHAELHRAWGPLLAKIGIRCYLDNDSGDIRRLIGFLVEAIGQPNDDVPTEAALRSLPQLDVTWQVDFLTSPMWEMRDDCPFRPRTMLAVDKAKSASLAISLTSQPVDDPQELFEFISRTMWRPSFRSAHRPGVIEFHNADCYKKLSPKLASIGIRCELVNEMMQFDVFCTRLAESVDESQKISITRGDDVYLDDIESYFEAAAEFFRKKPWQRSHARTIIRITCDEISLEPQYGFVLGGQGIQFGLCLVDSADDAKRLLNGNARVDEVGAMVVSYDDATIMAAIDLQLIERRQFPIVEATAYPYVSVALSNGSVAAPDSRELAFLDACLRAIPDFLEKNSNDASVVISTKSQKLTIHLTHLTQ